MRRADPQRACRGRAHRHSSRRKRLVHPLLRVRQCRKVRELFRPCFNSRGQAAIENNKNRISHPASQFFARAAAVRMDVTVVVGDNEPIESAIRRFKKDVTRSGHLFELRRRRYFETNTEKRLRKAAAARRKARMARNMKIHRPYPQASRNSTSAVSTPSESPASVTPLRPGATPLAAVSGSAVIPN